MEDDTENATQLSKMRCVPCQSGAEPLSSDAIRQFAEQLSEGWQVVESHHLEKNYKFKDFSQALEFVNKVGQLAELQDHHPDIYFGWGRVKLTVYTHKINGLHPNDFIFAAKVDQL